MLLFLGFNVLSKLLKICYTDSAMVKYVRFRLSTELNVLLRG